MLGGGTAVAVAAAAGYTLLPGGSKPTGDPQVRYGKETCARCGMIISDERFAAAWRQQDGDETHFDDVGCMVALSLTNTPGPGTAYYVRAFDADAWLDAPSAAYAVAPGIKSPMAYDIAAFASADTAAAFLNTRDGRAATWTTLPETVKAQG